MSSETVTGDSPKWKATWRVEKWHDAPAASVREYYATGGGAGPPDEVIDREGNLLVYGGGDLLWLALTTGLSGTTGLKNTIFSSGNAAIAVGSDNTAAAASQTDLQASSSTNARNIKGMEASYPAHTTGTGSTAVLDVSFRSVFSSSMASFAWQEWGLTNSTVSTAMAAGNARLLNRKVESLGTKSTSATWTFTVKLSLS